MSAVLAQATSDNFHASVAIDVATITLLVDAGLVTIEQAAKRLEETPGWLSAKFQTADVADRIAFLTKWLRAHDKPQRSGWTPVVIPGGLSQTPANDPANDPQP